MSFDLDFFISIFPRLFLKIPYTLCLGTLAFMIALVLGLLLEICYTSRSRILSRLAALYISYFRSTPYITQLFIFYFGLPQVFPPMRRLLGDSVLVITISMNSAAFIAEIIRGGLLSVDQGQRDAAYSIGLSPFLSYWEVILPQAFVAAFPALGNSFIAMIKNTAIGFMIGVVDILAEAKILAASSLNFFEAYLSVGVVYWGMLILIHKILRRMETRICRFL